MPGGTSTFDFGPVGNRVVALLGIALTAGALALASWSGWRVAGIAHDIWRARNWPSVQANILHVSMSGAREPARLGYFNSRIKYRYAYGNGSFEAGRLVFTQGTGETAEIWDGKWLATVVDFLEGSRLAGRPVPVFVNPLDPSDAVVFRDMVWGNYILLCLGMFLSGLPLAVAARHYLGVRNGRIFLAALTAFQILIALGGAILASLP